MTLATMRDAVDEYVRNTRDEDPEKCSCGGGGWVLSDYDTWHVCHTHNTGQPHPEDDSQYLEEE